MAQSETKTVEVIEVQFTKEDIWAMVTRAAEAKHAYDKDDKFNSTIGYDGNGGLIVAIRAKAKPAPASVQS